MADLRDETPLGTPACAHDWSHVEVRNQTWNRCSKCGLGELWAAGSLISSTDWLESERLNTDEEGLVQRGA